MLDTIYRLGNTVSHTYLSINDNGNGFSYSKIPPGGKCNMVHLGRRLSGKYEVANESLHHGRYNYLFTRKREACITGVSFCPMGVVTFKHLDDVREWEVLG